MASVKKSNFINLLLPRRKVAFIISSSLPNLNNMAPIHEAEASIIRYI